MNAVSVETLRRVIPALFVGGVLAFSFFAATPSLASSTNNCGVKGYGYHDHGKVCPNRPFPGHGEGLEKFGITGTKSSVGHVEDTVVLSNGTTVIVSERGATDGDTSFSGNGKGHGHGKAHQHGKGDNRNP